MRASDDIRRMGRPKYLLYGSRERILLSNQNLRLVPTGTISGSRPPTCLGLLTQLDATASTSASPPSSLTNLQAGTDWFARCSRFDCVSNHCQRRLDKPQRGEVSEPLVGRSETKGAAIADETLSFTMNRVENACFYNPLKECLAVPRLGRLTYIPDSKVRNVHPLCCSRRV